MVPKLRLDHCKWLSHHSNYSCVFNKFINALPVYKRALHSSFVVLSKSVVNSEFVDETHKSTNTVKYSVLYKSVSISVFNTSSRFSYEFRHFSWTNKLTCEKKKTNFTNGGKICLPRAPTSSSLLRIVNSNFYRTATQNYELTQRRRRAKVVDS